MPRSVANRFTEDRENHYCSEYRTVIKIKRALISFYQREELQTLRFLLAEEYVAEGQSPLALKVRTLCLLVLV